MAATQLLKSNKTNAHPKHDPVSTLKRGNPRVEAPDWGDPEPEAPEGRMSPIEAPDAGDSRASYLEAEFTHGRSQS